MFPFLGGGTTLLAGEGVFMNVVSCSCGLRSLTAILLEIGEARGEGVMTAGESPGYSDEVETGDGGVIFLNPLDVKPEKIKL